MTEDEMPNEVIMDRIRTLLCQLEVEIQEGISGGVMVIRESGELVDWLD
jgi:hypothetical protein